jgi:hypothetical protein
LVVLIVLSLNFASVLAAHGNNGAKLYGGVIFVFAICFFAMSLWRGVGGVSTFDWLCFLIAMAGIIGWQITNKPVLGIWLAAVADLVAYLPAFIKTWHRPYTESPWLYGLSGFGAIFSLLAYSISAVSVLQIAALLCGAVMLLCIYHKRIFSSVGALFS